jgi:hypothetical protein
MKASTMTRSRRVSGLLAALLIAFLAVAVARSDAQSETPQQVKATCVKAGLKKPEELKGSFWIQVYEHSTAPHSGLQHKALTMPESCNGQYRRFYFVNYRYETTGKGWRTFHGLSYQTGKPGAWVLISNGNTGTGVILPKDPTPVALFSEISSLEATKTKNPAPWGRLQQVKGRVRMWVKDEATGKIIGRKIYSFPTKFCRHPVHNDHACAF